MTPADRHQAIVEHLDAVGVCTYQDLAKLFGVSEMTIRRDVDKLVKKGGLIKIFGGLQTAHAPENLYESPIQGRLPISRAEKEQIARLAVQRIKPHQTIYLDGSTTCIVLARHIAKELSGLTVVTNSALVCLELGRIPSNTVFQLGGQFDSGSACCGGPTTEESARRFFVDIAFFSTKGFLPEEGTFESSLATLRIKQIVAEQAARVVLLADHSKFGQRALCKVLGVSQIHEVITDAGAAPTDLAPLERRGVVVSVALGNRTALEAASHAS
jgi:DeoR family transcriptional regulator, fructose operon transcriptional repressor